MQKDIEYYFRFYENVQCIPHLHSAFEIIFCTEGEIFVSVNETTYRLSKGDSVFVFPYELHSMHSRKDSRSMITEFAREFVTYFTQEFPLTKIDWRGFHPDERAAEYILSQTAQNTGNVGAQACLYFLCNEFMNRTKALPEQKGILPVPVYNAIAYINEHYSQPLSLKSMAERAGCSYEYLSKLFAEQFGTGFTHYLQKYRVQKAVQQLLYSEQSIAEIAKNSGFQSIRSFNRNFMQVTGLAPSDLRKIKDSKDYLI